MEHRDVVARRRMVRRFRPDPIDADVIERIARSATRGPSAGFAQGVTVVVVTDPGRRRAIARIGGEEAYARRGFERWLSEAPVHLVLCVEPQRYRNRYAEADKDPSTLDIPWWWVDAGAALSLVLLAAVDEGLAAGFLGAHALGGLSGLLGIPDEVEPVGVVTIGHPLPDRTSTSLHRGRRPEADAVRHETWEAPPRP